MEPSDGAEQQRRGACLSILLTGGAAGFFLLLLVLATGGWAIHLLGVSAAILAFGLIHYFLWGRLMLRQTAGEREEEQMRQRAEAKESEAPDPGANGVGRYH